MQSCANNTNWHKAIQTLSINQSVLFACDVVRLTIPVFELVYPKDRSVRYAIETTELFVYGKASIKQLERAHSAVAKTSWLALLDGNYNLGKEAFYAAQAASLVSNAASDFANAAYYVANAANAVTDACHANPQIQKTVQTIYQQTTPITISITPILKAIANQIVQTRNFHEYNILLDNLEEFHNIQLERTIPKGLSHYVLYHLTNTH